MKLTGKQFAQIQDAFLDAFSEFGLRQMTRVHMDTTLEHVVGGDNLTEIVFNLVSWADAGDQVEALIAAASSANPGNRTVQALVQDAARWFATEPLPTQQPPTKPDSGAPAPPEPLHPPSTAGFVGRMQELDAYARCLREQGIVAITGMPGVGKTSLAAVLVQRLAAPSHIFWHTFHQGEDIRSMTWRLAAFLAWHGQSQLWELLNKGGEPPVKGQLDYALQLVKGRGFAIVLDNFHLLFDRQDDDPVLPQLVERLESATQRGDVFVVVISRTTQQLIKPNGVAPLRGLSDGDTRALLGEHAVNLPDPVRAALHARTEGNPELLMLAIEALRHAEEPAGVIERLAAADDIEHYLIVEIDEGLDETDRVVMSGVAALLGYPATRDAIEQILERSSLKRTLAYLVNRYLLETRQAGSAKEYLQHAVLRDFYYDLLSKAERTALHQRAGHYYSSSEHDALRAAQHFVQARAFEQAAALAVTDVERTLARGQAGRLGAILAALDGVALPPKLAAQVKIAALELHQLTRETDAALAAGTAALAILDTLGDDPGVREARARTCWLLSRVAAPTDLAQARAYAQRGLDSIGGTEPLLRATLLIQMGVIHAMQREVAEAEALWQEALALLGADALAQRCDVLLNLGALRSMQGDIAGGAAQLAEALALSQELGDPFRQLKALSNLGVNKIHMGDWDGALVDMRYAYDLAERLGDIRNHAVVALNLGDVLRKRGAYGEAGEVLATALRQAEAARFPLSIANARLNLAHLALAQHQFDEAGDHLTAASEVIEGNELADRTPELLFVQAELLLAQEDLSTAWARAESSVSAARGLGMTEEEGIALRVQARVLNAYGRYDEVVPLVEQSLACLAETNRHEHALSQLELGLALERLNDETTAQNNLRAARRQLSELGAI